mmetsp:Transcript_78843/g.244658  ORF Transcript_78843/g.244658 Transcript_78843/m.244658 type:complete len:354 (+) Transcript_78843:1-1062(+)
MRRMALLHGLPSFPEDPPEPQTPSSPTRLSPSLSSRSPPCSPLSRPGSPALLPPSGGGFTSLPPSPTMRSRLEATRPSPLLLCRHRGLAADGAAARRVGRRDDPPGGAAPPRAELWLLQAEEERRLADPARREACRFLARRAELLAGRAVLEVEAGAGLVGLFASHYARSVTITTPTELGSRLARLNGTLVGTDWGKRPKGWSGPAKRQLPAVAGRSGPVPLYIYALPMTPQGLEDLARQWQWDSGTAMRALKPELVAPRFEVVLHAALGGPADSRSRQRARGFAHLASGLLVDGGLAVAAASQQEGAPLDALMEEAKAAGLEVEEEELAEDADGHVTRILLLRRLPEDACGR